jgi:K+/H+ antiporter YhaU regulatory subunit KhtT
VRPGYRRFHGARAAQDHGRGLDLVERPVGAAEVGTPVRAAAGTVIAVIRGSQVLAPADPRAARLESGDQLILVSSRDQSVSAQLPSPSAQ